MQAHRYDMVSNTPSGLPSVELLGCRWADRWRTLFLMVLPNGARCGNMLSGPWMCFLALGDEPLVGEVGAEIDFQKKYKFFKVFASAARRAAIPNTAKHRLQATPIRNTAD